eukprot:TRINITY_DN32677_c0_g1_i1.p1 TRINITY_DN32677_c0_g1~~TRINITY_DN32677_c0_g1_i1.p1  ORF type:complete len:561 (-),score=46.46 TRINITY_DN32677_c0_g1_i1:466-2148(-)
MHLRAAMQWIRILLVLFLLSACPALSSRADKKFVEEVLHKLLEVKPQEKYLWYAPHSGFGNQMIAFRHALRMAGLLNRTLIIPPLLRHFDNYLGRCEQGTARPPHKVRKGAWYAIMKLLQSRNYLSMADIVDISSISRDLVETIDLRLFVAVHCGINVSISLSDCTWCGPLVDRLARVRPPFGRRGGGPDEYIKCGHLLGSLEGKSPLPRRFRRRVSKVMRSCTETIWTYGRASSDNLTQYIQSINPSYSPPTSPCPDFTPGILPPFERQYIVKAIRALQEQHKRGVLRGRKEPEVVDIRLAEGEGIWAPKTPADRFDIMVLGSTIHYVDLDFFKEDGRGRELSCATAFLPFTPPIMRFAQSFAHAGSKGLGHHFACVHYRGSDGAFVSRASRKEHLNAILAQLYEVHSNLEQSVGPGGAFNLFLMSDMRTEAWRSRLGNIFSRPGFKVHFPLEFQALQTKVSKRVFASRYGVFTNRIPRPVAQIVMRSRASYPLPELVPVQENSEFWDHADILRDVGLFMEQAVCACAPWTFIGHPDSTISENIHHMRNGGLCDLKYEL